MKTIWELIIAGALLLAAILMGDWLNLVIVAAAILIWKAMDEG